MDFDPSRFIVPVSLNRVDLDLEAAWRRLYVNELGRFRA